MVQEAQLDEKKFWCKVFQTKFDILVAICDKEILGKRMKFKELKIKIDENFYKGVEINEKVALNLIKKATIVNLFGKNIVNLALGKGFIKKDNIIKIEGYPHAQIIKL